MIKFREIDQNPQCIAEFVEMIEAGEALPPIVLVEDEVLDGHHRARAYQQLGCGPQYIRLTRAQYDMLNAAGYDDMEITGAAHFALSDGRGAELLDRQFAGANLYDRAAEASELLDANNT